MSENYMPDTSEYIRNLEAGNRLTETAIRAAIAALGLFDGAKILDVPCGIGNHAVWMAEHNDRINITGVDFSEDHIEHAAKAAVQRGCPVSINFEKGDINNLCYDDNSFDYIWCCDGLWPGPPETGCLCEQPFDILKEFIRITKPGGKIAVLFWSSQKLLPGYPLVEAALNSTLSANFPVRPGADPDLHMMRAPLWFENTGLKDVKAQTFVADICAPLSGETKSDLAYILNMFWSRAEEEVETEIWNKYKEISSCDSGNFILNQKGYSAFGTYTMFTGTVDGGRMK